jgi:hypothetical protein
VAGVFGPLPYVVGEFSGGAAYADDVVVLVAVAVCHGNLPKVVNRWACIGQGNTLGCG